MGDTEEPEQDPHCGELLRRAKETAVGVGFAVSTQGVVSTFVPDGLAADLLSAGAAPVAQLAVVAGVHVALRLVPRLQRLIGVASRRTHQSPDEFIDTVRDSPELTELFARVMEAAAATRLEDKIYALGKALALGVSDPKDLDEAHMLVEALAAIEQPHVLLLEQLMTKIDDDRAHGRDQDGSPNPPDGSGRLTLTRSSIEAGFPYPSLLQPVLARTTGVGLVYNPSPGGFGGVESYTLSALGEQCVKLLREAANHPQ